MQNQQRQMQEHAIRAVQGNNNQKERRNNSESQTSNKRLAKALIREVKTRGYDELIIGDDDGIQFDKFPIPHGLHK